MNHACSALAILVILSSCQKQFTSKDEIKTAVVASEANSPLKCHTLTFTSDYPAKPGEVPPFSFTKTQYLDARVKTIRMISRKNPIHPAFKKEAVELIGTFTYAANNTQNRPSAPHLAFLKGTREVWEYYKTTTGAGARRSISKQNLNWKFYFSARGYCVGLVDQDLTRPSGGEVPIEEYLIEASYSLENPDMVELYFINHGVYYPINDQYGNPTSWDFPYGEPNSWFRITYDYTAPRGSKNFSYIPSQNLISQEFSLVEVMQWFPQATHARKSAGGTFKVNGVKVNQDQVYKNYLFDAAGNLKSLTYGDNILQKTTWHCQN